ncbi:MAG: hypothetical protein LBO74_02015 [Candidatus Symbiothrix sp.]|jgi:uncharacterized protein involved in exopolysaccharide biosynthesis|nr:hypothetical protein [Candidatus Symbiothrix sp.]
METPKNKAEKEQVLDFIKLCFQHWYYFVISGAVCLALGILYLKVKTPVYAVTAKVALRHDDSFAGSAGIGRQNSGMLSMLGIASGSESIEDETLILKSEGNIKDVVKTLELNKAYTLSEFLGLSKQKLYDQSPIILSVAPIMSDTISTDIMLDLNIHKDKTKVKVKEGKKTIGKYEITSYPATLKTIWGDFTLEKSPYYDGYKTPFRLKIFYSNYDVMTQIYQKDLDIGYQKKTSDLINLSMNNANVVMAKKILTTIIDTYNKNWDEDKEYGYSRTIDFINKRLSSSELELAEADRQIQEFKDKYNLTDIEADVKFYFAMSGEVQATLLETETQLNLADAIREFIQNESNKYSLIPFNLNSSSDASVAGIIEKYNDALLKRNELYKTNTQSAFAQSMDTQLEAQRKNMIQSLDNAKEGLQTALATIKKKDNEINKKIGVIPSVERDYIRLKRNQELQQSVYIFLLGKREETAVRYAALMPKLKMIDKPYIINDPVEPKKKMVALAVLMGTLVISLVLIFGMPYWKTLRKNED